MSVSPAQSPIRVMIVEDSLVVRQLLTHIIGRDPRFVVVKAVASAEEALEAIDQAAPDIVSMDIRLPGLDGLEATRRIMSERPTPIVVIADAVNDNLRISMNALRAGALTVVEKPVGPTSDAYETLAETICTQLFIMSSVPVIRQRQIGANLPKPSQPRAAPHQASAFQSMDFLALAASTGGPPALARVLEGLPAAFPAPVFVVQHMGAAFMEGFAAWLDGLIPLRAAVARDGEVAEPGRVYVAPGDRHMTLSTGGLLRLSDAPPVRGQRPSATSLFQSMARAAGPRSVAVLLTGMGEDGARGLLELREAGGHTIAEHESSAVVYGMPGVAARIGAAREVLALDAIPGRIAQLSLRSPAP